MKEPKSDRPTSIRLTKANEEYINSLVEGDPDRSVSYFINQIIETRRIGSAHNPIKLDAHNPGISTYQLLIEFELQNVTNKDEHAFNILKRIHNLLLSLPGTHSSKEMLNQLAPMQYDAAQIGNVQPFGYEGITPTSLIKETVSDNN